MATTRPKVALNALRDMPFNKLMLPVSAERGRHLARAARAAFARPRGGRVEVCSVRRRAMPALPSPAAELARLLSEKAERVCRHYLSTGRRCGHYWTVGDVGNTPGRSLYVRLRGPSSGKGAAGKWCDAATGEHGDLIDLIRLNCGFESLSETLDEARSFLSVPRPEPAPRTRREPARRNAFQAARRLFAIGRPVLGTLAEAYLRARGITAPLDQLSSLRFHPGCYYRATDEAPRETWPALLTAITDVHGSITAVHRTWLARDGSRKAPIEDPRRSLGHQLGSGVRLGLIDDVLTVGEGLETMLSAQERSPSDARDRWALGQPPRRLGVALRA